MSSRYLQYTEYDSFYSVAELFRILHKLLHQILRCFLLILGSSIKINM